MTMSRRPAIVTAVAALVLATAYPSAAQNREHQQQAAELRILQEQQQQLSIAISQLGDAIKALHARLDEVAAAARKGFADQELSIRNVSGDLSAIRERTQETDTRIRTIKDEIDALRTTVNNLPSQLASQLAPPPPAPVGDVSDTGQPATNPPTAATPPPPTPPVAQVPSTAGLSPTRMLDSAKSDYFAGQWALAVSGFEALLRAFPQSESAGEAQFYIGETYYAQNKWTQAVDAYGLVLQNYRTSTVTPDAYYKRGRAYEQLGQIDAARAAWQAVVQAYPDSDAARLAQQALDKINRAAAPAR